MKQNNKAIEPYRKTKGQMASDASYGNNGVFELTGPRGKLRCIVSDGMGWEHVSITFKGNPARCPTWEEMCFVKELFWSDEECVIQYHPAKSEYVNNHPHCLHLWKPQGVKIPIPPSLLV